MNDHDGIMSLLQIPDPVEKRLALKSKQVEPYHLRHALQDADPHIRHIAATHPNLTKELMREALSSDDKDLRHSILSRPDLDSEELDIVATHPDHALEVANHPKCTEEIREKALAHHAVPEGVKNIHADKLSKSIGHITYPLLGEGKVYTKPMAMTPDKMSNRVSLAGAPHAGNFTGGFVIPTMMESGADSTMPEHRLMTSAMNSTLSPKRMNATEGHEAQHSVFARIGQKHGENAQQRVVATTLSKLPEQQRHHIRNLFEANGVSSAGVTADPEETLSYLHNYLQDPTYRNRIHARLGMHDIGEQQESVQHARKAWNNLRRIGMSLRPEEVGITPEKHEDRVSKWVKQLAKRESIPSDQLGFSVSFLEMIAICEFLTHRNVDQQTIRESLRHAEGDSLKGVLSAFGLNTEEGRKAFGAVKNLKLHKSEDVLKVPKSIVGIDNEDVADLIKDAYQKGQVEPVALGGKHSGGAYIAKDDESRNWLLKPGSGKKSPAAGVEDTKGSQSRREALFSAIANIMGIKEVQPAALLQVDGKEVAAIRMWPMSWVNLHRTLAEDKNLPRRALEPYRKNTSIWKWAVLDYVAGNPDRHGNNLMVSSRDDGNKIGLIDHGSALAGYNFDPGNDKDSFVPYYLRVWSSPGFHQLDTEGQLKQMPMATNEADEELRSWVKELNPKELESTIYRYGMDPGPAMARLAEVQSFDGDSMSRHINLLWLESPIDSTLGVP